MHTPALLRTFSEPLHTHIHIRVCLLPAQEYAELGKDAKRFLYRIGRAVGALGLFSPDLSIPQLLFKLFYLLRLFLYLLLQSLVFFRCLLDILFQRTDLVPQVADLPAQFVHFLGYLLEDILWNGLL